MTTTTPDFESMSVEELEAFMGDCNRKREPLYAIWHAQAKRKADGQPFDAAALKEAWEAKEALRALQSEAGAVRLRKLAEG